MKAPRHCIPAVLAACLIGTYAVTTHGVCAPRCVGDCNDDGAVAINELIVGVQIALGTFDASTCQAMDANGDGGVAIDELVLAVEASLASAPPPSPTPTSVPAPPIGAHRCALASESVIELNSASLPVPIPVEITGTIDIVCGAPTAAGTAPCDCRSDLEPKAIPGIGFVCVRSEPGCPTGLIACAGGDHLDVVLVADGDIGRCDGNDACAAACDVSCAEAGQDQLSSGCTGYCAGGGNDGQTCRLDTHCPGGACNGQDPVTASNVCQCQCANLAAGGAGAGGELQCAFGVALDLESAAPCGDGDVFLSVGRTCVPATTGSVSLSLTDANRVPGATIPRTGAGRSSGQAVSCEDLRAGSTHGLRLRGGFNVFGSPLGDIVAELSADCE